MQRRDFMGAGLVGAALGLTATGQASAAPAAPLIRPPRVRRPLLINRQRAERLMAEAGLDAIVVRDPSNVYYASNHWSLLNDYGSNLPMYAVIPRSSDRPVIAVIHATALREMIVGEAEYGPSIVFDPKAADKSGPNRLQTRVIKPDAQLSPMERRWLDLAETMWPGAVATPEAGIAKALKELGVARGRVGVDDARIQVDLGAAGFEGPALVDAIPVMLRIRQVKTAPEIALSRAASQATADAALAAMNRVQVGMTRDDIRLLFREETARHGAAYVTIMVGLEDLPNQEVERGKPFMIDAVASIDHYIGDFGRTVVVGEPTAQTKRMTAATAVAWEAIFRGLRPGMRGSDLGAIGREAVTKAGLEVVGLGQAAHSVGLQHSEDPTVAGRPENFVFEPGMILSVDHPYIEFGWGSSHLEDVSVITDRGAETLNTHSKALVVVPA